VQCSVACVLGGWCGWWLVVQGRDENVVCTSPRGGKPKREAKGGGKGGAARVEQATRKARSSVV